MAVLGILLVLAAAAFLADVAVTNSTATHLNMFGHTQTGMTNAWVFLYGAAAGFVLALGIAMMISGLSRRARRRRAHRDALSQQRAETERLAAELERERRAREETTAARAARPVDGTERTAIDQREPYPAEGRGAHAAADGDGDQTVVDHGVARDGEVRDGATANPAVAGEMTGHGRHATARDDRAAVRE